MNKCVHVCVSERCVRARCAWMHVCMCSCGRVLFVCTRIRLQFPPLCNDLDSFESYGKKSYIRFINTPSGAHHRAEQFQHLGHFWERSRSQRRQVHPETPGHPIFNTKSGPQNRNWYWCIGYKISHTNPPLALSLPHTHTCTPHTHVHTHTHAHAYTANCSSIAIIRIWYICSRKYTLLSFPISPTHVRIHTHIYRYTKNHPPHTHTHTHTHRLAHTHAHRCTSKDTGTDTKTNTNTNTDTNIDTDTSYNDVYTIYLSRYNDRLTGEALQHSDTHSYWCVAACAYVCICVHVYALCVCVWWCVHMHSQKHVSPFVPPGTRQFLPEARQAQTESCHFLPLSTFVHQWKHAIERLAHTGQNAVLIFGGVSNF